MRILWGALPHFLNSDADFWIKSMNCPSHKEITIFCCRLQQRVPRVQVINKKDNKSSGVVGSAVLHKIDLQLAIFMGTDEHNVFNELLLVDSRESSKNI